MNTERLLKELLAEFYDRLASCKEMVKRDAMLADVEDKIKVVIGMRRAGKTYFVYQYIQKLLNNKLPREQILYLNFEDDRLQPLTRKKMVSLLESFYTLYPENHDRKCYIILDEIQNVDDWQVVVRRFFDTKKVEIILTGSSAKRLSKEIATNLRGRSLATEIWPYSFSEYLRANNCQCKVEISGIEPSRDFRLLKD